MRVFFRMLVQVVWSVVSWLFLRPLSWRDRRTWPVVTGPSDRVLFRLVVALIAFGVVMVYSASYVRAISQLLGGQHYVVRQAIFASLGLLLIYGLERVDYHHYRVYATPLLLASLALMVAVVCGLGHRSGGATRWIALGPIHVQPAEIAKRTLIIWLAASLADKTTRMTDFKTGVLPHLLAASVIAFLCVLQPDFGAGSIALLLTFVSLYTAGARARHLLTVISGALLFSGVLVWSSPYRTRRLMSWSGGLIEDAVPPSYQVTQSLLSLQAGGWTGVGLGQSHQKRLYLPECHTDFIAAIITEELGMIGFVTMLCAFAWIVQRGVRAALRGKDIFGLYLGIGLSFGLGIEVLMNLAVNLGVLPPKGLALPLVSFGGSSLVASCAAVGVLLNISRPRRGADELTTPTEAESLPADVGSAPSQRASALDSR